MAHFDVEKILNKRMKNGKIEYKVKWLDFSSKHNKWIPLVDMNCDEKVTQFESSRFEIIGCVKTSCGIQYAMKYFDLKIKLIESSMLVDSFPDKLVTFLESNVVFNWPNKPIEPFNDNMNISACTNQGGQGLKYLFSSGRPFRIVASKTAISSAAKHVVQFLESKLDLDDCFPYEKRMTRIFATQVHTLGVKLFPKVKIERNLCLEKALLLGPQGRLPFNVQRAQVVGRPDTNQRDSVDPISQAVSSANASEKKIDTDASEPIVSKIVRAEPTSNAPEPDKNSALPAGEVQVVPVPVVEVAQPQERSTLASTIVEAHIIIASEKEIDADASEPIVSEIVQAEPKSNEPKPDKNSALPAAEVQVVPEPVVEVAQPQDRSTPASTIVEAHLIPGVIASEKGINADASVPTIPENDRAEPDPEPKASQPEQKSVMPAGQVHASSKAAEPQKRSPPVSVPNQPNSSDPIHRLLVTRRAINIPIGARGRHRVRQNIRIADFETPPKVLASEPAKPAKRSNRSASTPFPVCCPVVRRLSFDSNSGRSSLTTPTPVRAQSTIEIDFDDGSIGTLHYESESE